MDIKFAKEAWRLLNGVFCVYKPSGLSLNSMRKTIIGNLCRDLKLLDFGRPQEGLVKITEDLQSSTGVSVEIVPNLADDVLAVGPRYQEGDIKLGWAKFLDWHTAGVCVLGVNNGCSTLLKLQRARFISVYQLSGRFGRATDNYHEDGRVLVKSTYRHIRQAQFDRVLASIQASHQRQMYNYMGVDIQSEEAYEMASAGLIRPYGKSDPLIYGLRCLVFDSPEFLLEVQCINETEAYLTKLVHDIGLTLKSTAVCCKVRQVKYGHFGLDLALLRKYWTVEHVLNNIKQCKQFVKRDMLFPKTATLMMQNHG